MLSIKHHVEYLAEALADARAVKVVEARRVLKEAKARLTQARLCAEITPSTNRDAPCSKPSTPACRPPEPSG